MYTLSRPNKNLVVTTKLIYMQLFETFFYFRIVTANQNKCISKCRPVYKSACCAKILT